MLRTKFSYWMIQFLDEKMTGLQSLQSGHWMGQNMLRGLRNQSAQPG